MKKCIWNLCATLLICVIGVATVELINFYTFPRQDDLAQFNKTPYLSANGFEKFAPTASTLKILFLGNSITYHSALKEDPDQRPRGLTATTVEKDFVHLLVKKIAQEKKVNVAYSIFNIADFERNFTKGPLDFSRFPVDMVQNPDYVIFQIGENVLPRSLHKNENLFILRYAQAVNHFKGSTTIICLPWWPNAHKNKAITQVAMMTRSYLVDISHLGSGLDKRNYASSYKKYALRGAGKHPSDYGMQNIANVLWTVFNAQK